MSIDRTLKIDIKGIVFLVDEVHKGHVMLNLYKHLLMTRLNNIEHLNFTNRP